jgi:hypothetical protein
MKRQFKMIEVMALLLHVQGRPKWWWERDSIPPPPQLAHMRAAAELAKTATSHTADERFRRSQPISRQSALTQES